MAGRKRSGDVIIQTSNGQIFFIAEQNLGKPVGGDSVGMRRLRAALARCRGAAVGLRTAVAGYRLPPVIGQNNIVCDVERGAERHATRVAKASSGGKSGKASGIKAGRTARAVPAKGVGKGKRGEP